MTVSSTPLVDLCGVLGVSPTITVQAPSPSISVTPTSVPLSGTVTVTIANGPGNVMDWVALYPAGAPDSGYTDWRFLNGQKTAPATGLTAATLTFQDASRVIPLRSAQSARPEP